LPDVDPGSNGDLRHTRRVRPVPAGRAARAHGGHVDPARRGRAVVTLAVVSASTGAFLLLWSSIAGLLRHLAGVPVPALFVLVVLGAFAGVWVGAWLACRLTGGDRRRFIASGIGGSVGLVAAVGAAFASTRILPAVLPLLAILCPGAGAVLGARAGERERRTAP